MSKRFRAWRHRRSHFTCGLCRRELVRGKTCGRLKVESQDFPDGGWVQWRSWTPCSVAAPGGVHPPKPLLDECGDLDDVNLESSAGSIEVR